MVLTPKDTREGRHFTVGNVGKFQTLGSSILSTSKISFGFSQKSYLKEETGLKDMEVSINRLEPGKMEFFEKCGTHGDKLFVFLKGAGELYIDDDIVSVKEGTILKVDSTAIKTWANNTNEDLYFICIQGKEHNVLHERFFDGIPL